MALNEYPKFPATVALGSADLVSATPITSRANITGTTGLVQLTPAATEAKQVTAIRVKAKGTSVASQIFIWLFDGTTSRVIDEIAVTALTASNTSPSFSLVTPYTNFELPASHKLYVSQTVQTDVTVFAHGGDY